MTDMPPISRATLHTSMGDIVIELFPNHAPKTVANFVELAAGMREWVTQTLAKKPTNHCMTALFFIASLKDS